MTKPSAAEGGAGRWLRWFDAGVGWGVRPLRATGRVARRMLAFALIALATILTKGMRGRGVVRPLVLDQIRIAGLRLLPFIGLLSLITGLVLVGQTVSLLQQFGAQRMLGTVLVVSLFRELAPLATALVVLLRVGAATVVELATMRATGEVEALEALSIDPVHYLVVPRVVGMAVSVFCLTVYFLIGAMLSGYLFCFLQGMPLTFTDYLNEWARALGWQDFVMLLLKTGAFGGALAVITCYQGLSRPLRLEEVPEATTRAVSQSLAVCVLIDAAFVAVYLLT